MIFDDVKANYGGVVSAFLQSSSKGVIFVAGLFKLS